MNTTASTQKFTDQQTQLAKLAKALGHPARIAILEILVQRNSCFCGDLVAELPLAQATVSQHLKVLKEAGIIEGTIDPRNSCYFINRKTWAFTQRYLQTFFEQLNSGPDCC